MAGRLAADIVVIAVGPELAAVAVEVRRAQAGENRGRTFQESQDQGDRQVFKPDLAAFLEKRDVSVGRLLQFGMMFDFFLRPQLVREIDSGLKPGRIENLEIVGKDGNVVTPAQSVAAQKHAQGPAAFQLRNVGDDVAKRKLISIVAIDGVEAGRAASEIVGLRQDFNPGLHDDQSSAGKIEGRSSLAVRLAERPKKSRPALHTSRVKRYSNSPVKTRDFLGFDFDVCANRPILPRLTRKLHASQVGRLF